MRTLTISICLGLTAVPVTTFACGFCKGDRAAATYSFDNRNLAARLGFEYVTVEVVGNGDEFGFGRVVAAIGRTNGVLRKTVRSAYAQRAVSFVLKPGLGFDGVAKTVAKACPGWALMRVEETESLGE